VVVSVAAGASGAFVVQTCVKPYGQIGDGSCAGQARVGADAGLVGRGHRDVSTPSAESGPLW